MPAAVTDLTARANATQLSLADRRLALDTLAFVNDPAASKAMLTFAAPNSALREPATVWLLNRMSGEWADYGLRPALKSSGIYDPEAIVLKEAVIPRPAADLPGTADRGRRQADR